MASSPKEETVHVFDLLKPSMVETMTSTGVSLEDANAIADAGIAAAKAGEEAISNACLGLKTFDHSVEAICFAVEILRQQFNPDAPHNVEFFEELAAEEGA